MINVELVGVRVRGRRPPAGRPRFGVVGVVGVVGGRTH
jgi:hypothetical protein